MLCWVGGWTLCFCVSMFTKSIEDVEFGIEGGSQMQVCFCSLVRGCSQKFLCTCCPGKATFRQSISWGKSFPNRDRFAYKSPVLLMPGFPRSVILHAGKARELLKNNVPTHQSCWRHVGKLSLPGGRMKETCERVCVGVHRRTSYLGACMGIPQRS